MKVSKNRWHVVIRRDRRTSRCEEGIFEDVLVKERIVGAGGWDRKWGGDTSSRVTGEGLIIESRLTEVK